MSASEAKASSGSSSSGKLSKGQKRARKRKYVSGASGVKRRKQVWDITLSRGHSLIYVTCMNGKEGICQNQMQSTFQQIAEEWLESEGLPRIPVDESKELEDGKSGSAELASGKEKTSSEKEKSGEFVDIAAELKAEKDKYDYKNVTWIRSTIGSIILYFPDKRLNPVSLLNLAFEQKMDELSPLAYKLVPIERSCVLKMDAIVDCCRKLIKEKFVYMATSESSDSGADASTGAAATSTGTVAAEEESDAARASSLMSEIKPDDTFAIDFKRRGVSKHLDRGELVKAIAAMVPSSHKVDLTNPRIMILVETFRTFAGVSIITGGNYKLHQEYSLVKAKGLA